MWGLHHVFQYAAHVAVDVFHLDGAVLSAFDDIFYLLCITRSEQVVSCSHLTVGVTRVGPVGHYDALEAPFVTKDSCEQFIVFLRPRAIQVIV